MACNCTKCSQNCGCADTALTNACTYTDCSVGSERCSDVQCAECVSYCGTSFQNTTPIVTTINNYTISNLLASTAYKVKVTDNGNSANCKPIEILFSTLAV